jgi:hypothetical protein
MRGFRQARVSAFLMQGQFSRMKAKSEKIPHKLGANPKEPAVKTRKRDPNFKQSRDVREDRGERQMKTGGTAQNRRG